MKSSTKLLLLRMSVGTGRSSRSTKEPYAGALLKMRLDFMATVSRPKVIHAKSPKSSFGGSQDVMIVNEIMSLPYAKIKLPPSPPQKRKLIMEFLNGYAGADAKAHELWPKVDRLWVPASR